MKSVGQFLNRGWVPNAVKKDLDRAKASVYRLKITLMGLRPPVWRRVLMSGDVSLARLHWVIQ
ncbi:MAG: hypothetical protein HY611_03310 [Elusimicrobia bacterium]|nr:hypothetical protein [Elusimicrobiota bacterium]